MANKSKSQKKNSKKKKTKEDSKDKKKQERIVGDSYRWARGQKRELNGNKKRRKSHYKGTRKNKSKVQ